MTAFTVLLHAPPSLVGSLAAAALSGTLLPSAAAAAPTASGTPTATAA